VRQTEPSLTKDLLALARRVRGLEATKHSDQFTSGIPDVTLAWNGFTSWVECKLLRPGTSPDSEIKEDQLVKLTGLQLATKGRAWFMCWDVRRRHDQRTEIWSARTERQRRLNGKKHWIEVADASGVSIPGLSHERALEFILGRHRG
jgi:hypothetical protein